MKVLTLLLLVSCTPEKFEDAYFEWAEHTARKEGKRLLAKCFEQAGDNVYIKQECIVRDEDR